MGKYKKFLNIISSLKEIINAFPYKVLENQAAQFHSDNILIPKKVYQTWKYNKIPKNFHRSIMEFRKKNSDFEFILFTDQEIDQYMYDNWRNHPIYSVYNKFNLGALKADIWRYCIIYDNGGFYFDLKSGCSDFLSKVVHSDTTLFVTNENNDDENVMQKFQSNGLVHPDKKFAQWVFGSVKKSEFLKNLINSIPSSFNLLINRNLKKKNNFEKYNTKKFILDCTGPNIFTKVLKDYILKFKDKNIQQAGIDIYGKGIYDLKHSRMRFLQNKHYSKFKIEI